MQPRTRSLTVQRITSGPRALGVFQKPGRLVTSCVLVAIVSKFADVIH